VGFQYNVTLNDPGHSPQDAALLADVSAAVAHWARYLGGLGSLNVQVNVLGLSGAVASGGPGTIVMAGTDAGRIVYRSSAASELLTGTDPNGSQADLRLNVDPGYLASLWLDPNSPMPLSKYDGLTVFMHEIGHGLGILTFRNAVTGALSDAETEWDRLVSLNANGTASFNGTYAKAIYGGPVPVTTLQNGEQYSHIGNSPTEPAGKDVMLGTGLPPGVRYDVSDLDLAIMKDLGLKVLTGTNLDPLLDPFYYNTAYADVSAAHAGAVAHYNESGWREGRDPSAWFSTIGYLAANPDVAAARVNPLQHFEQSGWREGRDATAGFDNAFYLARNPDVGAAGLDPLAHYAMYGQFEGRETHAAVGPASGFKHGSFDAEYYLLANPDVARVALAQGAGSLEFAYAHYESHGWQEGRNPNSVFDVRGYRAAHPDVAAAGVDPLLHYDQSGWREGRDPSAGFDTGNYLSHYADVAAAQVNPLLHFLQYGLFEGRSAFADNQIQ
jgi:hypothetical protein